MADVLAQLLRELPIQATGVDVTLRDDADGEAAFFVDVYLSDDEASDVEALVEAHERLWNTAMDSRNDSQAWVYVSYLLRDTSADG